MWKMSWCCTKCLSNKNPKYLLQYLSNKALLAGYKAQKGTQSCFTQDNVA